MTLQEIIGLFYELAGEEFNGSREQTEDGFILRFDDGEKFEISFKALTA